VSVFSDPDIVALLKDQFIPAAVDNHHIEKQKDAEGDFYRSVASRQGEYICTVEGKLLASTNTHSAAHMKGLMLKALKEFQPAAAGAASEGTPDARFHRAPPEGGLVVRVTTKVLGGYEKSAKRNVEIYQESLGRDNVWIEADETKALIAGAFPDSLKKRIASYHLVDNTRGEPPWWRREEVRVLDVELGRDGRVKGKVHLETEKGDRGFTGEVLGFVTVTDGKVTRFDLVAKGDAWGAGRYNGGQPPGKYPIGFAFALSEVKSDADRLLPQGACRGNFAGYFAR
jgi:hypothetical protein